MRQPARVFRLLHAAARLRSIAVALEQTRQARTRQATIELVVSDADACAAGADALELVVEALGTEDVKQ